MNAALPLSVTKPEALNISLLKLRVRAIRLLAEGDWPTKKVVDLMRNE